MKQIHEVREVLEKEIQQALNEGLKLKQVGFGDGVTTCCAISSIKIVREELKCEGNLERIDPAAKFLEITPQQVWSIIFGFDENRYFEGEDGLAWNQLGHYLAKKFL